MADERIGVDTDRGAWLYQWAGRRKPFLHPVATPSGRVLTRTEPADHPWHRGLWFAIKYVNGENFWEEVPPYGVVRHAGPPTVERAGGVDGVRIDGELEWIRPDRETVAIVERRTLSHVPLDDDGYAIDIGIELTAAADAVLDRTPFDEALGWGGYGGLTLRGRPDWVYTRLLFADGTEHDRVTPKRSAWCDLTGSIDGAAVGLAILDAPANPRHPAPFYGSTRADTYGAEGWSNFLNAAFLFEEPLAVAAGDQLRFAYRVIVHDDVWSVDRLAQTYDEWVGSLR